jgi:hypothetical protein
MLALISILSPIAVIGAVDLLAMRFGVDSRRDDGRSL